MELEEEEDSVHHVVEDPEEEGDAPEATDYRFLAPLLNKKDYSLPARGEKDFEPDGTQKQDKVLDSSRDAMYQALSVERDISRKAYIGAIWRPDMAMARVDARDVKGMMFKSMGRIDAQNDCWLLPEELLYLVERGNVECFYENKNVPMSLQGTYAECIPSIGLDHYQVYAYLKRAGYIILRTDASRIPIAPEVEQHSIITSIMQFCSSVWLPNPKGTVHRDQVYRSFTALYHNLDLVPCHTSPLFRSHKSLDRGTCTLKLSFDIWKPNTRFRKSKPGPCDFQLAIVNARETGLFQMHDVDNLFSSLALDERTPQKQQFNRLIHGSRRFILAVVDLGVISFLSVGDTSFGSEPVHHDTQIPSVKSKHGHQKLSNSTRK